MLSILISWINLFFLTIFVCRDVIVHERLKLFFFFFFGCLYKSHIWLLTFKPIYAWIKSFISWPQVTRHGDKVLVLNSIRGFRFQIDTTTVSGVYEQFTSRRIHISCERFSFPSDYLSISSISLYLFLLLKKKKRKKVKKFHFVWMHWGLVC